MRTGQVTCDRCQETVDENYAQQNGWLAFRIEPIGGVAYAYRRDLCGKCAGEALEFIG